MMRFWILLLAATCFLAGFAASEFLGTHPPVELASFHAYATRFCEDFGIDPDSERARHLRVILRNYEDDKERVASRHRSVYSTAMEQELAALGTQYEARIRDKVVPPQKRALYQALAGEPPTAPAQR